jgi:hypothetical protein
MTGRRSISTYGAIQLQHSMSLIPGDPGKLEAQVVTEAYFFPRIRLTYKPIMIIFRDHRHIPEYAQMMLFRLAQDRFVCQPVALIVLTVRVRPSIPVIVDTIPGQMLYDGRNRIAN